MTTSVLHSSIQQKELTPQQLVEQITSNSNVFLHGASATPVELINLLCERKELENVRTCHIHLVGDIKLGSLECTNIRPISLFTGQNLREAVNQNRADHVPIFLSDIPSLFSSEIVKLDYAIVQVSPPDRHGFCSLGTSVDTARAAVDNAAVVLAQINEHVPRTHGNSQIHISKIKHYCVLNRPLIEHAAGAPSEVESKIGRIIADLIEDGATLQMGIGAIPDAVLQNLKNKSDLGVHTEMFSDGLVDLYETGAITNALKSVHPGRIVTSFVAGTKKVFDFVDDNPIVEFHPCERTNDTSLIRKNDKVVAINSALSIDLSGQVCADSLGTTIFSGIGGQMDFIRGAALSKGGKAIIALPSTAAGGKVSRIVPILQPGSGVVTTRGHVQWVVTEYGAVNLFGRSLAERAELLRSISHPDFR